MFFFLLFLSRFLVEIQSQSFSPRALKVETCKNQSQYSWIVSIQRDGKHTCNGLVIKNNTILTTALCVERKLNCTASGPNPHIQVLSIFQAKEGFPTGENCRISGVQQCLIHYKYEIGNMYIEHDYAAIILADALSPYTLAPLYEERHLTQDFSKYCTSAMVTGWWYHFKQETPSFLLECFPVTVRHLQRCSEVTTHVYLRKSTNHTLTCSYDASNRYEVCSGFYGAPLVCNGTVIGMVSHKFNFSEECVEVSPFFYARMDWCWEYRRNILKLSKVRRARSSFFGGDCDGSGKCGSASVPEVSYWMFVFFALFNIV